MVRRTLAGLPMSASAARVEPTAVVDLADDEEPGVVLSGVERVFISMTRTDASTTIEARLGTFSLCSKPLVATGAIARQAK
jgi:hypothetical protein